MISFGPCNIWVSKPCSTMCEECRLYSFVSDNEPNAASYLNFTPRYEGWLDFKKPCRPYEQSYM